MCTAPLIIVLALGCASISLASRYWRLHGLFWGIVPLSTVAAAHCPFWVVLALGAVLLGIETFKRRERFLDALVIVLIPLAIWNHRPPAGLSTVLANLALIFALQLGALEVLRFSRQPPQPSLHSLWADLAAAVLFLSCATLVAAGMMVHAPLLLVLGLSVPVTIPAAMREILSIRSAKLRLRNFAALAEWTTLFREPGTTPSVSSIARDLHQIVQPILGHDLTVIGINPAIRFTDRSFATAPRQMAEDEQRIGARIRYLFRSGRCASLPEIPHTSVPETPLIQPGMKQEIIVPVRRGERSLALVGFSGKALTLANREIAHFAKSVRTIMLHVLMTIEEQQDLALLSHRSEQEGRRLRSLLKLNERIAESADLKTLANNLVRTVCVSFGFSWTGFLLARQETSVLGLAAWSGEDDNWMVNTRHLEITSNDLDTALSLGSTISRFHVIPLSQWPLPIPHPPNVTHLLATPIAHGSHPIGYLLILPNTLSPIPDLKDLRALEILVEQIGPVVASGLHLEQANLQTLQDPLTGIANRRALDQFLRGACAQAKKTGEPLSFAMLDVDDFKRVNDHHGHQIGDVVLEEIAAILQANLRTKDFLARYGGEEFSIVLPDLSAQHAFDVLERLRIFLATTPFASAELTHPLSLTISVGISTFPSDGQTPSALIQMADAALYRAKRHGKNCVTAAWEPPSSSGEPLDEPFAL